MVLSMSASQQITRVLGRPYVNANLPVLLPAFSCRQCILPHDVKTWIFIFSWTIWWETLNHLTIFYKLKHGDVCFGIRIVYNTHRKKWLMKVLKKSKWMFKKTMWDFKGFLHWWWFIEKPNGFFFLRTIFDPGISKKTKKDW